MPEKRQPVEMALRIISRRRLSTNELKTKMKRKNYSEEEIDRAISYLTESHYLNDEELLSDYIKHLIEKKMYGPERVVTYLKKKGYDPCDIRMMMNNLFSEDLLVKNALDLIRKKMKNADLSEPKMKDKAIRTLFYNGYNWDIIERILNQ